LELTPASKPVHFVEAVQLHLVFGGERGRMRRVIGVLAAAAIVLMMVGIVVLIIWLAVERSPWAGYVTGGLMVASGIGLTFRRRGSDEDLRRVGGEAYATRMRQAARGGWRFIVLGAAIIALTIFFG